MTIRDEQVSPTEAGTASAFVDAAVKALDSTDLVVLTRRHFDELIEIVHYVKAVQIPYIELRPL